MIKVRKTKTETNRDVLKSVGEKESLWASAEVQRAPKTTIEGNVNGKRARGKTSVAICRIDYKKI